MTSRPAPERTESQEALSAHIAHERRQRICPPKTQTSAEIRVSAGLWVRARHSPDRGTTPASKLITPGVIAAELRVPLHRVLHVLATQPHVQPTARAGTLRLYNRRAVAMVRYELNAIDARRRRKESPL
jgi:hypothetical protein